MPQDVTFDLPFETPSIWSSRRAQHLCWIRDMDLVHTKAGFEECTSWDVPQAAGALPDQSEAGADLMGRERFRTATAEAAMQVLVL
jgi:hypothetical protein